MIVLAEEAGAELAIGCQAGCGAMAAEGLCHPGRSSDFAGRAIGQSGTCGGLAALRAESARAASGLECAEDFRGRDDEVACPVAVGVEGHDSMKRI